MGSTQRAMSPSHTISVIPVASPFACRRYIYRGGGSWSDCAPPLLTQLAFGGRGMGESRGASDAPEFKEDVPRRAFRHQIGFIGQCWTLPTSLRILTLRTELPSERVLDKELSSRREDKRYVHCMSPWRPRRDPAALMTVDSCVGI